MSGQVQATKIPHQVPEDDGVLAKELVGVDHLEGKKKKHLDFQSDEPVTIVSVSPGVCAAHGCKRST